MRHFLGDRYAFGNSPLYKNLTIIKECNNLYTKEIIIRS